MHIFPNTDTRIIDYNGVIIIVLGVKTDPDLYRVMVDGVFCGFLKKVNDVLIPTAGSNVRPVYIEQIYKLRNGGSGKLKFAV